MGNIFKTKAPKPPQVTEQDKAILQIKQQRDKVKQFQKKLVVQLESESEIIKQLVQKGQKPKALTLLRKKKYTEKTLDETDKQLLNIDDIIMKIEFKSIEKDVIEGIQHGNEMLKQLNAIFSIEQIESILEETEEGVRKQQEISDLMRTSGYKEDDNEEALNEELESILGNKLIDSLPDAPEEDLPASSKEKNKEKKAEKAQKKVLVEA